MEMYEYDSLCDRFGENQVKCKNCRNFNPVEFQNNPSGSIGFCAAQCFEIDAANGTSPIILLNSRSNCYTPDAVKQDFWPTQDLLDMEKGHMDYKATLRSLDADLRREAAAW